MIINQQNLKTLYTGFKTVFNEAFSAAMAEYDKLAMTVPSTTSKETYGWLGTTTKFREWLGDRVVQNLEAHDWTIKNVSWENTIGVDRDSIEDDTYGVYRPLIAQLGEDAKRHPDELVFDLLARGFTEACYDGQYFFDTDHPVAGGSVSNFQGGTGTAWYLIDGSRQIKPIIFQKRKDYNFVAMDREDDEAVFSRKLFRYGVDARVNAGFGLWQLAFASRQPLDVSSYADARAQMMAFQGDNGKPLGIRPTLLVVPPSLEKAALEVVQAERLANGATNVYRGTAQVLVSPFLS